jgi:general secretion pathway protein A
MYTHYFSLKQPPFSIAPDPRYLFMSERHREALAHLLYGVGGGGGFVLLTGEIGAGKTTVCRCFIEQIPANCRLGYIFNPKLTVEELLQSICDEFRIGRAASGADTPGVKGYVDAINGDLLARHAQGMNSVLIIDEAQNLSADVLEQLRLLTNLETNERKLLQIILIGQPELRDMLAHPQLEQLAQRVIARYHLASLSERDTGGYVAHRLAVAGAGAITPFSPARMGQVYRLTRGVPRRINLLCDRALLGVYVENRREVTRAILRRAAREVFGDNGAPAAAPRRWLPIAGGLMAGVALSAAAWQMQQHQAAPPTRVAAATARSARPAPAAASATAPATAPVAAPGTAAVAAPATASALSAAATTPAVTTPAAASTLPVAPGAAAALPASPAALAYASADDALRALAGLWGHSLSAGAPCQVALKLNLRCHQGRGGLYELRQLDRPAVLTLHDGAQIRYALLTAVGADTVTLRLDGKQQTLGVAAVVALFDGEFTTFWTAPRAFRSQLSADEQGADVDWIAARLAQLNGRALGNGRQRLDQPMQEELRRFQLQQNLKADGVAGPRTYMRLSQLGRVPEPRLLAADAGGK